jgi:hypothetical protein
VVEDVGDPAKWGFTMSPEHPKYYEGELEWTFVMHKKEDDVLARYGNRLGFLHFITDVHDPVKILGADGSVEAR